MSRSVQKKFNILSRKIHFWGSITIALPVLIVIGSGLLLQLKKELAWVQPPTEKATPYAMSLTLEDLLAASRNAQHANVSNWSDIDRIDVRPNKGIAKVRAKSRWEIQIDTHTGQILSEAYRRSDLIESIHDGSFFHEQARLWVFLPAAIVLFVLWLTGMYLFVITLIHRKRSHRKSRDRS